MKGIVKPAVILFFICVIVSGALALTNSATYGKITERQTMEKEKARKEVLSIADVFKPVDDIKSFTENNPETSFIKEAYTGLKDGTPVGYVFLATSKGYGGDINITIGIDNEGKITGVNIGDNNETPGLGSKAKDVPFISQFKDVIPQISLTVVKNNKSKPEEISAISGATITSKAVVDAVQAAVQVSKQIAGKEGI